MDLAKKLKISTERNEMDESKVHSWTIQTYWAKDRTIEETKKIMDNSKCFGLFADNKQVAFARVISDTVVYAYLMDVLVDPNEQGKGYSKMLINHIMNDKDYKGIQKWALATKDAHELYKKFGFTAISKPEILMEKISVYWE